MKTMISQRKRLAGFSLVELAIALLIMSILMSVGLSLATVKRAAAQREATQKNQEAIKQALISYLGQHKRLPCPAKPTGTIDGKEDRNTTNTTPPCNKYTGIVPYYELGLDRTAALDGWENFITYVITPIAIATPPAAPYTTAWLYTFKNGAIQDNKITPTASTAFWPFTSTGGIIVKGESASTIADPNIATGAVIAIISYGKNGYGAINVKGGTNANGITPVTNTDEVINFNPLLAPTQPTVVKRDVTDNAAVTGGSFDDIVTIMSANDLTGPLITNGTFQSAQAVLGQANNLVLGNIVAHPNPCPGDPYGCSAPQHYFTIPLSTPADVTNLGVIYTRGVFASISTLTPPGVAYTLDVGDGNPKSVSIDDLRGILLRTGF